jgi:hypothetical protein
MTAHVLTKAKLQAWVDMLSDEEVRKAMQAKLDADPDWVQKKIEKAMQAAFDELVEKGVLTPKGLNEHGRMVYRSDILLPFHPFAREANDHITGTIYRLRSGLNLSVATSAPKRGL